MKKIFAFALFAGTIVMSSAAQSKFDAEGRSIMGHYADTQLYPGARLIEMPTDVLPADAFSRAGGKVSVFVTLEDGYSADDVEALGFDIVANAGKVVIVSGTIDNIISLENYDFVRALSFGKTRKVNLDTSREVIGVDQIQEGTDLNQAYTGKGVITGIYDVGMDPNHANFLNADTKATRVTGLWEVADDGSTVRSYTSAANIAAYTTENASETHGTHTLGCMSGSYNRRGGGNVAVFRDNGTVNVGPLNYNPYYGMAIGADIAISCGTLTDLNIIKGVELLVDHAKAQNKPLVINLSLGDNNGAHDIYDPTVMALDEYGKDAIICISAGNEGQNAMSIDKTFTSNETSFMTFYHDVNNYVSNVDIWSDSPESFVVTPFVYNRNTDTFEFQREYGGGDEVDVTIVSAEYSSPGYIKDPKFSRAFSSSYINITTSKNEGTSKRYNALLRVNIGYNQTTNSDQNLVFGFKVTGKAGQRIMVSATASGGYPTFKSLGEAGFIDGSDAFSINSMASGNNTLCVGAWNARNTWPTTSSGAMSYGPNYLTNVGGIADFSSYGTLVDGRTLPHVCAPGVAIVSSISKYYYEKNAGDIYLSANQKFNERENHWMYMQGTSMSSPIVAGSIALWLEADPTLTIADVQNIVKNHSIVDDFVKNSSNRVQWGAGKFDALAGLKYVIEHSAGVNDVIADDGDKFILTPRGENAWEVYVPLAQDVNVAVYNTAGQVVKDASAAGSELQLDVNDLSKGIYILNINGVHSTRVVVK